MPDATWLETGFYIIFYKRRNRTKLFYETFLGPPESLILIYR